MAVHGTLMHHADAWLYVVPVLFSLQRSTSLPPQPLRVRQVLHIFQVQVEIEIEPPHLFSELKMPSYQYSVTLAIAGPYSTHGARPAVHTLVRHTLAEISSAQQPCVKLIAHHVPNLDWPTARYHFGSVLHDKDTFAISVSFIIPP